MSKVDQVSKFTKRVNHVRAARAGAVSPVMKGGMPRTLGMRIVSLTRKKVIGEMPIEPMHLNPTGGVNGGAIMAFADAMGAAGAVTSRPPGYRGGTIESKTNFFAAGTGPVLSAVSIPLHIGRTTTVWQTTVWNADGRKVAVVTQTQIMLPRGPERAPGSLSDFTPISASKKTTPGKNAKVPTRNPSKHRRISRTK